MLTGKEFWAIAIVAAALAGAGFVLAWIWWRAEQARLKAGADAQVRIEREAMMHVEKERGRAARVEAFEKLLATSPDEKEVFARLEQLEESAKRRLSSECANMIGFTLAKSGRREEALRWLDEAAMRDEAYFLRLNACIRAELQGFEPPPPGSPKYPFHHLPWPGLASRLKVKARLLHDLERHGQVEAELGTFVENPAIRFIRAEFRRQRGSTAEALNDYKVVLAREPENEQARYWVAELSGPPAERSDKRPPEQPQATPSQKSLPASPRPQNAPPRAPSEGRTTAWDVLGISPDATEDQVRIAYLALSRKYHPDLVATMGDDLREVAEVKMREINYAWKQLNRA